MKATITIFLLLVSGPFLFAQNKSSFTGTITSGTVSEVNNNQVKNTTKKSTTIEFATRSIKFGAIVYDIVNKKYQGGKTTIFNCTRGRGSYVIKYEAGSYVSVSDKRTPGIETRYGSLKE